MSSLRIALVLLSYAHVQCICLALAFDRICICFDTMVHFVISPFRSRSKKLEHILLHFFFLRHSYLIYSCLLYFAEMLLIVDMSFESNLFVFPFSFSSGRSFSFSLHCIAFSSLATFRVLFGFFTAFFLTQCTFSLYYLRYVLLYFPYHLNLVGTISAEPIVATITTDNVSFEWTWIEVRGTRRALRKSGGYWVALDQASPYQTVGSIQNNRHTSYSFPIASERQCI